MRFRPEWSQTDGNGQGRVCAKFGEKSYVRKKVVWVFRSLGPQKAQNGAFWSLSGWFCSIFTSVWPHNTLTRASEMTSHLMVAPAPDTLGLGRGGQMQPAHHGSVPCFFFFFFFFFFYIYIQQLLWFGNAQVLTGRARGRRATPAGRGPGGGLGVGPDALSSRLRKWDRVSRGGGWPRRLMPT